MQVCSRPVSRVNLRRLLPDAHWFGPDDVDVAACVCDSRQAQPGVLFAALPGSRCDGHDFIADAVARGAAALLSERPVPEFGLPNCVVANARDAYGRICQALAGNPSYRLKLVGITGTNGKTTTSCLLASILATAGHPRGVAGHARLFRRRNLRTGAVDHPLGRPPGRLVGPHRRQRLLPCRDGSFQPCPEPVAGGGRPLRRRLRDQRQPRPPRLSSDHSGLPAHEVETFRPPRARGLRGDQRRRPDCWRATWPVSTAPP